MSVTTAPIEIPVHVGPGTKFVLRKEIGTKEALAYGSSHRVRIDYQGDQGNFNDFLLQLGSIFGGSAYGSACVHYEKVETLSQQLLQKYELFQFQNLKFESFAAESSEDIDYGDLLISVANGDHEKYMYIISLDMNFSNPKTVLYHLDGQRRNLLKKGVYPFSDAFVSTTHAVSAMVQDNTCFFVPWKGETKFVTGSDAVGSFGIPFADDIFLSNAIGSTGNEIHSKPVYPSSDSSITPRQMENMFKSLVTVSLES